MGEPQTSFHTRCVARYQRLMRSIFLAELPEYIHEFQIN